MEAMTAAATTPADTVGPEVVIPVVGSLLDHDVGLRTKLVDVDSFVVVVSNPAQPKLEPEFLNTTCFT